MVGVTLPGDPSIADSKAALRRRIRDTRAGLDPVLLGQAARGLRDVVLDLPEVRAAACVAAYVSVGREPGTGAILDGLAERGVRVLLPIVLPDLDLDWAPYTGSSALVSAARGLLEPTSEPLGEDALALADVVLVPALAVDRTGYRLGLGGGCYDRALARVAGRAFTCALLHEGELLDLPLPRDQHDVPVHAAATPSGIQRLRG